jgi:4-hydroxy-tetrahydrodipicolinate synthase
MPDVLGGIINASNTGDVAKAGHRQARFTVFHTHLHEPGFLPTMMKQALHLQQPTVGARQVPALQPENEQDAKIRGLRQKHEIV